MSLDKPLLKALVTTTIPEEASRESTPVIPRRNSEDLVKSDIVGVEKQCENDAKSDCDASVQSVVATVPCSSSEKQSVEERLAQRRKSFQPMSSMEEENLRERLHLAQLRQCSAIVYNETRYTKDNFRKMFTSKASDAKVLNNSDAKNASADAQEALKTFEEACQAASDRQFEKIDKKDNELKRFLEKGSVGYNEMINTTITEAKDTFAKLQKRAQEKNVEIAECLDGKLDEIKTFGPVLIKAVEECAIFALSAYDSTSAVLNDVFMDIRSEGTGLKIDSRRCKDDECFNGIAEGAKKLLSGLDFRVSGMASIVDALLENWKKEVSWCYLIPQLNYHKNANTTVKNVTKCVNEKIQ